MQLVQTTQQTANRHIPSSTNSSSAICPAFDYVSTRWVRVPNQKSSGTVLFDTFTRREQMDLGYLLQCFLDRGGFAAGATDRVKAQNLANRLTYCSERVSEPNQPRIITKGGGVSALNLWKPHPVDFSGNSVTKEQVPLFVEYMERMFPIDAERQYMYWWLAHAVRNPETKIVATPVLRSSQGTGKSFLTETILRSLMGENAAIGDLGMVTGQFQDFVLGKTVICLDEVYCDKKRSVDALKVFQSNHNIVINQKHQSAITVSNHINFIITSNEYEPVVFESSDRRFFIPQWIEHKVDSAETQTFIQKLADWISNSGAQLIRDFLEAWDLSAHHPKAPALMTHSKSQSVGLNYEDRLQTAVEDIIKELHVTKTEYVWEQVKTLHSDLKDVGIKKVWAVMAQAGCERMKLDIGMVAITPNGLANGVTTSSKPKDVKKHLPK